MLPTTGHDTPVSPDTLTGVLLNYQWRKIIVGILVRELPKLAKDETDETVKNTYLDRVDALIEDIYTPIE